MLLLVLADRHVRRLVEQDVGRHQHRIGVEAEPGHLALLAGLFLELGHPVEPAERGQAAEQPGELGVGGDHALVEDDAALGVDAGGDIGRGHLARRGAQLERDPAAGSARADRRCRRCSRNRAAARPSCGSRRDNCRDADCRSAGCRKRCGSCGMLSLARRCGCQAGWRRNRPRSSRQSVTPSARISSGERDEPGGDQRRPARASRSTPARRAPGRAARASAASTAAMPSAAAAIRGRLPRARAIEPEMAVPRQQPTAGVSACIQPAARQRDRHADMGEELHQQRESAPY